MFVKYAWGKWSVYIWGLVCQKQVSRAGTSNYILRYFSWRGEFCTVCFKSPPGRDNKTSLYCSLKCRHLDGIVARSCQNLQRSSKYAFLFMAGSPNVVLIKEAMCIVCRIILLSLPVRGCDMWLHNCVIWETVSMFKTKVFGVPMIHEGTTLTLPMLEIEYSGYGGQYHVWWCTGS